MADQLSHPTNDVAVETAEAAFRRIARRKLVERHVPEDEIDFKLAELLRKGAAVQIDMEEIFKPITRP